MSKRLGLVAKFAIMQANSWIRLWLWTGIFMVLVQVAIGGITRLTDSGLSMTTWEPITGALPPMNEEAWQRAFEDYRRYPEFYKKNADFSLAEFKSIFWWEYIHRAWARLIGVVFAIPFIFFLAKGYINRKLGLGLLGVMLLGAAQALMGWIMVKSGMIDSPWVSPYRLTMHLLLALAIFGLLYRMVLALGQNSSDSPKQALQGSKGATARDQTGGSTRKLRRLLGVLSFFVLIQIAYGGLMAGSDAARHFNSWPTMNGKYIPQGLFAEGLETLTITENRIKPGFIVNVQFIHRFLALVLLGLGLWLIWSVRKAFAQGAIDGRHVQAANWVLLAIALQFSLGVGTILLSSPAQIHLPLGVLHQFFAFILTGTLIRLHFLLQDMRASSGSPPLRSFQSNTQAAPRIKSA